MIQGKTGPLHCKWGNRWIRRHTEPNGTESDLDESKRVKCIRCRKRFTWHPPITAKRLARWMKDSYDTRWFMEAVGIKSPLRS